MYSCLYVRSGSGGGGDGEVSTRNAALFGHVSFSGSTWLRELALRIGFLMASGGAYICTVRSHLASCKYVHSLRWKFATLALRTCREASHATRKVFFRSLPYMYLKYTIDVLVLCMYVGSLTNWVIFGVELVKTMKGVSILWEEPVNDASDIAFEQTSNTCCIRLT